MQELEVSAEKYIIGCLVTDFAYTNQLARNTGLEAKHFESSTARTIWEIGQKLYSKGIDIDAASVIEAIEAEGKHLDAKAAASTVLSAITIATSSQSLPMHVSTVLEKHSIRSVKQILEKASEGLDTGETLEGTVASIKHRLSRMGSISKERVSIEDRLKSMRERYCNIRKRGCSGIHSRWPEIQRHTAGYPFGKITVLGARPKMGKSTMALNEAIYSATVNRTPTLFFSLEMDQEELFEKAGADIAEVDNMNLKSGRMSEEDIERFMKHGPETVAKCPLFIEDNPSQNVEQICAKVREYAAEKGVRFVVIDYLQIISSLQNQRFQSKTYEIQHMTNELRIVAKETGVAMILLSQISRPFKGGGNEPFTAPMPELHDLKDSGAIEQDAYIVMFIGPCTVETEPKPSWLMPLVDPCTIRIAANRGGSTGEVHMHFHKPYNKFLSKAEFEKMKKAEIDRLRKTKNAE
jgi:replicative DNA helicase